MTKAECHLSVVENFKIVNLKSVFRSDHGGEFWSILGTCKNEDIVLQMTNAHTPEQSGLDEKLNRAVVENVRYLQFKEDLQKIGNKQITVQCWNLKNKKSVYLKIVLCLNCRLSENQILN